MVHPHLSSRNRTRTSWLLSQHSTAEPVYTSLYFEGRAGVCLISLFRLVLNSLWASGRPSLVTLLNQPAPLGPFAQSQKEAVWELGASFPFPAAVGKRDMWIMLFEGVVCVQGPCVGW